MSEWMCPRCGKKEPFWEANYHECIGAKICPECHLTKPCECED